MAGEVLLINPRRRRARRKRTRTHRKARAHRRRRVHALANPHRRRRRRVSNRRAHRRGRRRRIHRNPRLPLIGGINLGAMAMGTVGFVGTRYGTGFLMKMLPAEWSADPNTAPLVRIGAKLAVGVVLPKLLGKALRFNANALAAGGLIAVGVDIFETYLAHLIPLPLADYEGGELRSYEPGLIADLSPQTEAYGGGPYG